LRLVAQFLRMGILQSLTIQLRQHVIIQIGIWSIVR
jgi:hypothetical protein